MHPLSSAFRLPLSPIDEDSPRYRGVYSYEEKYDARSKAGVTEQFLGNAETYHSRYTNLPYWTDLIRRALDKTNIDGGAVNVLDIGSGSGNSVFPMLDLLPDSQIVATDISPDLLGILHNSLTPDQQKRCLLVAMDASDDVFHEGAFDIAVGAAILHHIIDPSTVVASTLRALKPGGFAIFYEPFESGAAIFRLMYENLLARRFALRINRRVANMMRSTANDFELRASSDKSAEIFQRLDDKWVFTRTYFEKVAAEHGCKVHSLFPVDTGNTPYANKVRTHLKNGLGLAPSALSKQAWDVIAQYDALMSPDLRQEVFVEGCIIFTK